ncbi:MAG: thermonuclease family protein, partial [Verrucomicrobiota bacterium]
FNIYKKDLYRIAGEASAFTAEALEDRFTVWTCWQDAGGQSRLPRYFGIVLTADGKDLAELLVEQGYARIYGAKPADSPVQDAERVIKELKKLEARARRAKTGAWAYSRE